jgi:hypothetical protein
MTSGRLPVAALMARAIFFDDCGKSVPADQNSGPSAGTNACRGSGRDWMPIMHTGMPPRCASQTTAVSPPRRSRQRSSGAWS